jgi:hypothetical protein
MLNAYETSGTSPTRVGDRVDFRIENLGSIFLVIPITDAALTWIEEHVTREGFQPYWPTVVVEHRYIDDLVEGIRLDGMAVL